EQGQELALVLGDPFGAGDPVQKRERGRRLGRRRGGPAERRRERAPARALGPHAAARQVARAIGGAGYGRGVAERVAPAVAPIRRGDVAAPLRGRSAELVRLNVAACVSRG